MNRPRFLAVDLDIESKEDLAPLVADLGERAIVLHSGPTEDGNLLSVQSACDTGTPDSAISAICQMIEALSPQGRRYWETATRRTLDVGVEVNSSLSRSALFLNPDSVKRVAAIGATLAFTIYHEGDTEQPCEADLV
jgi:hypothetical protein